jgi:hypothetical protein
VVDIEIAEAHVSEAKYTAGPWRAVGPEDRHSDDIIPVMAGKFEICEVYGWPTRHHPSIMTVAEAEANAKLIAAAPELLECAKTALSILEKEFPNGQAVIDLRNALAKAGGRS